MDTFEHDGLQFPVTDALPTASNTDGGAEPIVLLHGFPQRRQSWEQVTDLLNAQGFRTLCPDQRGYAATNRPKRRRDYALALLVDDVVALLDAAQIEKAHLVGHDWGASVAAMVAARHPDRITSLVTVSVPHPRAFQAAMFRSNQALKSWYMLAAQLPVLPELSMKKMLSKPYSSAGPKPSYALDDDGLTAGIHWYRALPLTRPSYVAPDITVPTTHVWSTDDAQLVRASATEMEKCVQADYELVILEGVSHFIPDEAPGPLAEAILERARSVT